MNMVANEEQVIQKAVSLINSGKKMEAVRMVRRKLPVNLVEAKDYVDEIDLDKRRVRVLKCPHCDERVSPHELEEEFVDAYEEDKNE